MRRAVASVLTCVLALTSAPLVHADSESDGKDLFAKGRDLRTAGHCDQAMPLFRKAYKLYPPGLGSILNLAQCEEEAAMWASSHRDWLELKRALLTNPDRDTKYVGWDKDAEAGAARTAPKVAKLTIDLVKKVGDAEVEIQYATAKGLTVHINGEATDLRLLATELDRDPGSYEIVVDGGKAPVRGTVVLAASESKTLKLLVDLPPEPVPITPVSEGSGLRTFGWAALIAGGVGVVGTGISLVLRQSALSKVKSECGSDYASKLCNPDLSSTVNRGKTASLMVDVFGALAIVGLGTGAIVLATSSTHEPSAAPPPATAIRFAPWAGATGGGAALFGSF